MKYTIESLRENGNLLESILGDQVSINIIRVWGYESRVGNVYYQNRRDHMDSEDESKILEVISMIIKKIKGT